MTRRSERSARENSSERTVETRVSSGPADSGVPLISVTSGHGSTPSDSTESARASTAEATARKFTFVRHACPAARSSSGSYGRNAL